MKIVQDYFKSCSREVLLDAAVYRLFKDYRLLMELKEMTIADLIERHRENMDRVIDKLISIEPVYSDNDVVYLWKLPFTQDEEYDVSLVKIDELEENMETAYTYAIDFEPWEKVVGYLVADTETTQNHIDDLLGLLLEEMTFFGMDHDERASTVSNTLEEISSSVKEIESGNASFSTMDEVMDSLGVPREKPDEMEARLRRAIAAAEMEYNRYQTLKERKALLESLHASRK